MASISFDVSYTYNGGSKKCCRAKVTLYMPPTKDFLIPPLLRAWNMSVFGEYLTDNWGRFVNGQRSLSKTLEGESWTEVTAEADKIINEAISTLTEVMERNRSMLSSMPPAEEKVFDL